MHKLTSDVAEIWYVGSIWVSGGREMVAEIQDGGPPQIF